MCFFGPSFYASDSQLLDSYFEFSYFLPRIWASPHASSHLATHIHRDIQKAEVTIVCELARGRWRRVPALVRAPGAVACVFAVRCLAFPSRPPMEGKALEKFWKEGRAGTLSPQMQALAWGMSEAGMEPVDIAAKVTKVGGGNPSREAVAYRS